MSSGDERFFVRSAGRVTGPFTRDRLTELKRLGRLPGHCELSRDRLKWESAAAVFGEAAPAPTGGGGGGTDAQRPVGDPPAGELWYYTDPTGNRVGPVSRAQVAALAAAGAADAQTLVWKDGMPDWQPYLTQFPAVAAGPTAGAGGYGLAEVGGLLLMIAGWLWVAALTGLTAAWAISWGQNKILAAGFFLPGILGLAHLLVTGCGMAFLLTAPGRHGVRASLITGLAFAAVHVFLLLFVVSDFSDTVTRLAIGKGAGALVWSPVVSALPDVMEIATGMIDTKRLSTFHMLLMCLGLVEAGRYVCVMFAARGLSTAARSPNGRGMSLSAVITLGAVAFAVNLAVLSANQHVQSALAAGGGEETAKYAGRVQMWTQIAVYLAVTALAVLYGLAVTFTYTGFKRANRAGWL